MSAASKVNKPALTPWFPAGVKPVRPGFYEVERLEFYRGKKGGKRVRRVVEWTGSKFRIAVGDEFCSRGSYVAMFESDNDKWRGLASDPKAGQV